MEDAIDTHARRPEFGPGGMDDEGRRRAYEECNSLMETLDAALRAERPRGNPPWQDIGFPVIDRQVHAVFPLLVAPMTPGGDSAAERDFIDVADRLWWHWGYMYGGHGYRVGYFSDDDEWGRKVLRDKLQAHGEWRRDPRWWDIGSHVVVLVTAPYADRATARCALHVVPRDWVFAGHLTPRTNRALSHCRTVERTVAAADLDWDWPQDATGALWATSRRDGAGGDAELRAHDE